MEGRKSLKLPLGRHVQGPTGQRTRAAFASAVHALVDKHSAPDYGTARLALLDLSVALRALGPHVHRTRLQWTGQLALHAALARCVLPGKYPRLVDAVADICDGRHQRMVATHSDSLSRLIVRLGGAPAIARALERCPAMSRPLAKSITTVRRLHSATPVVEVALHAVDDGTACQRVEATVDAVNDGTTSTQHTRATSNASTLAMLSGGIAPLTAAANVVVEGATSDASAPLAQLPTVTPVDATAPHMVHPSIEAWTRLAAAPGTLPDGWADDMQQGVADRCSDVSVEDALHGSLMLVLPAKDRDSLAGYVPVLMDNGASWEVHCNRTLDGAILDTYQPCASELTVGKKGSGLASQGSYLYVIDWYGSDGTGERVVERMMHTPDLPFRAVASEPTLVYGRKYKFTMAHDTGRVMRNASGHDIPLWMSKQKLGWMKARFVTDPHQQQRAMAAMAPMQSLAAIGKGELRSAGVPTTTLRGSLRGVDLLRHEHVVSGHLSLRKLLILLKARGLPDGYVTKKDVEEFIKQSCGICESTKMRRRPFTVKVPPLDTTIPLPGKVWILDELVLDVPSADHGFTVIAVAVDRNTDMAWLRPQLTQDADDVNMTHSMLKAFVQPTWGDIFIMRKDSLPAHKSQSRTRRRSLRSACMGSSLRLACMRACTKLRTCCSTARQSRLHFYSARPILRRITSRARLPRLS